MRPRSPVTAEAGRITSAGSARRPLAKIPALIRVRLTVRNERLGRKVESLEHLAGSPVTFFGSLSDQRRQEMGMRFIVPMRLIVPMIAALGFIAMAPSAAQAFPRYGY